MTQQDFINGIIIMPQFKAFQKDEVVIRGAIKAKLPRAINRVVLQHPFDFAVDITNVNGGSVDGQSDYSCPGKDDDAMQILSVRYGDDLDKLSKMSLSDFEDEETWLASSGSSVNIYAWAPLPTDDGTPKIRLLETPDADGDVIKYRYHRKNLTIEEFPEEWLYVVESALLACMEMPNTFDADIREMLDHFDTPSGNPNPVRMSKYNRNRNIIRNQHHGY
jgi:hypothetical protein